MEPTDIKREKSKREEQLSRLRKKYPERRLEEDEEIYGAISDEYDEYDSLINGYKEREEKLSKMFSEDPRSAQFLVDMYNGNDPVVGLVRNFGIEIKDVLDDPEMQEKISEANKEYVERVARSRELDAEYERNLETSLGTLEQFKGEYGLSDEEVDGAVVFLLGIVTDGVMGKFSKESLEMAVKAMNHDTDVAAASEEGKIAGRNAKITEQLRQRRQGDGTTPLGGKHNEGVRKGSGQTMFDLAHEAM